MDHERRRSRGPQLISLSEIDPDRLQMPSFEDDILRDELMRETAEAINTLPDMDGEMLRKWIFEGRSYRDLSEEYGMSYDAVAKRIRRGLDKVRRRVKGRLSGIILIPWEKMVELMGGVVMKVSTKVAITGAVVLMLGGAGVWMVRHRGEEKPVLKPSGVKVKQRMEANVSPQKDEKGGESDDLTFEQFNALLDAVLDEYFGGQAKETIPTEEVNPPSSLGGMAEGEIGEGKGELKEQEEAVEEEIPEELRMAIERINELDAGLSRILCKNLGVS
jgi:hypothetical protein